MGTNARHHLRVAAEIPAVVHRVHLNGDLGAPESVRILDLSAGGALLAGPHSIGLAQATCLRIGEGGDRLALTASGRVVRYEPGRHETVIAVEFHDLNDRAKIDLIREVLGLAYDLGLGATLANA